MSMSAWLEMVAAWMAVRTLWVHSFVIVLVSVMDSEQMELVVLVCITFCLLMNEWQSYAIVILQMLMNVLKEFITVPVKAIENVATPLEDLNVFVMMVMKRIAGEHG